MKYFTYRGKRHYINFTKAKSNLNRNDDDEYLYRYTCGDFVEYSDGIERTLSIESFLRGKEEEIKSYYSELVEDRIGYKCILGEVKSSTSFKYVPVICKVRIPKGALVYDGPFDSKKRATEAWIEKIYSVKESYLLMQKEYDLTDFIRPAPAAGRINIKALKSVGPFSGPYDISSEDYLRCDGNLSPLYYSIHEVCDPMSWIKQNLTIYKEGLHIDLNDVFNFEPRQCAAGFHYFDSELHAAGFMSRLY